MRQRIYKILRRDEWNKARQCGHFAGSSDDLRDGYIHLSTADQLARTAERHFSRQRDLVVVAVDAGKLGEALRWEVSRSGTCYPHLYGTLETAVVVATWPLPLGQDGIHEIPAELTAC